MFSHCINTHVIVPFNISGSSEEAGKVKVGFPVTYSTEPYFKTVGLGKYIFKKKANKYVIFPQPELKYMPVKNIKENIFIYIKHIVHPLILTKYKMRIVPLEQAPNDLQVMTWACRYC